MVEESPTPEPLDVEFEDKELNTKDYRRLILQEVMMHLSKEDQEMHKQAWEDRINSLPPQVQIQVRFHSLF